MPDDLRQPELAPELASQVPSTPPASDQGSERALAHQVTLYDPTTSVLAYLITLGFFGFLFLLCFKGAPNSNLAMLNIVLGSLGTAWVGAMAYFFGATQAGRTKDWMLFQSQPSQTSKEPNRR